MVRVSLPLALGALVSFTIATPVAATQNLEEASKGFRFEDWANAIAANPDGEHLSPEEAIQVFNAADIQDHHQVAKRDDVTCNSRGLPRASLADSVTCINQLAARGSANCHIPYAGGATLCQFGLAEIHGATVNRAGSVLPCQTFAASAGRILDICVRPGDTTVQGNNHPNQNIQITLAQ
ncbi:hypothetical protein B0I35DRAFT_443914 [Stachybotrys elegans]|uniref:FAD linked oxidase N-terminal domain-containing protein n=1 Tax=Stachybotrys elegans TaxID=80388 RepID=A0A8K0SGT9_9HYPO|nr:hypothetical protein B0I35DRAFT_443914 [Stachybotrys elegans]